MFLLLKQYPVFFLFKEHPVFNHVAVAINAARTRIETAWRELNAKQQERDSLIAALEALGPGDEAAALELMSVESHR